MSGVKWIQTVWHFIGIPERIFRKSWFWKKISKQQKKHTSLNLAVFKRQWKMYEVSQQSINVSICMWWAIRPRGYKTLLLWWTISKQKANPYPANTKIAPCLLRQVYIFKCTPEYFYYQSKQYLSISDCSTMGCSTNGAVWSCSLLSDFPTLLKSRPGVSWIWEKSISTIKIGKNWYWTAILNRLKLAV